MPVSYVHLQLKSVTKKIGHQNKKYEIVKIVNILILETPSLLILLDMTDCLCLIRFSYDECAVRYFKVSKSAAEYSLHMESIIYKNVFKKLLLMKFSQVVNCKE